MTEAPRQPLSWSHSYSGSRILSPVYLVAILLGIASPVSAQTDSSREGSGSHGDSVSTAPSSYAYTLLAASVLLDADNDEYYMGSIEHHFSSASIGSSGAFGFATLGAHFVEGFLVNGGIGAEVLAGRFSIGVTAGVYVLLPYPIPAPYLEGMIGYEIPIADGTGLRLQAGPLYFMSYGQAPYLRADIGFVVR